MKKDTSMKIETIIEVPDESKADEIDIPDIPQFITPVPDNTEVEIIDDTPLVKASGKETKVAGAVAEFEKPKKSPRRERKKKSELEETKVT